MIEHVPRVAYQGERGASSEHAITELFPHCEAIRLAQCSFADVRRAVLSGAADYGVLPVESSLHGPVAAAAEVLAKGGLAIVDRVTCPRNIEDRADNQMRFVLVVREATR